MAQPLLAHLVGVPLERANALPLFANADRLARKPRCSETKDHSIIRSAARAITHPYIQPNSPVSYARLIFDLDWHQTRHRFHKLPLRYLANTHAWENELGVPAPNWAALSPDKNSAHICYELKTPVGRHERARIKPQQYLAAIESALAIKLGADEGYTGQLCKNPLHVQWDLYRGPETSRDMHELAEYVELKTTQRLGYNRTVRGEVGRNIFLFDSVRYWAYDNINAYRVDGVEAWEQSVSVQAERINATSYEHMPFLAGRGLLPASECRAIGRSVARWTWANYGKPKLTQAFSELQSWRGARGAQASAASKRFDREKQILQTISQLTAQGQIASMGRVAATIGCSKSTLSMHYAEFFKGTVR